MSDTRRIIRIYQLLLPSTGKGQPETTTREFRTDLIACNRLFKEIEVESSRLIQCCLETNQYFNNLKM